MNETNNKYCCEECKKNNCQKCTQGKCECTNCKWDGEIICACD